MAETPKDAERTKSVQTPAKSVEKPSESTSDGIIAYVKCKVLGICETAGTRAKTDALKGSMEALPIPAVKVDLDAMGSVNPKIGRTGIARKILFGNNADIIATNGTLISDKDEALLAQCRRMPKADYDRSAYCAKLAKTEPDAIRLQGTAEVRFARNLKDMWEEKIAKYGKANPDIQKFYDARIRPIVEGRVKLKPSSRHAFEARVRDAIESVRSAADFDAGLRRYEIDPASKDGRLAKALIKSIGPNDLIGIALTEIMDSKNGEFNLRLLDTVLASGGEEYFGYVPALADPYVSYGPYQHTKMSVGKDGGATIADDRFTRGAILKTRDIMTMPIADQHAAAYLLALHNTAMLVRDLDVVRIIKPAKKGKKKAFKDYDLAAIYFSLVSKGDARAMGAFYQYLGAAHNNPREGIKGLRRWIITYAESQETRKDEKLKPHIKNSPTAQKNSEKQRENHEAVRKDRIRKKISWEGDAAGKVQIALK